MKKTRLLGKRLLRDKEGNHWDDATNTQQLQRPAGTGADEQQRAHGGSSQTANRNSRAPAPVFSVERQLVPVQKSQTI